MTGSSVSGHPPGRNRRVLRRLPGRLPGRLVAAVAVLAVVVGAVVWWTREPYSTDLDALERDQRGAAAAAPGLAAQTLVRLREAVVDGDPGAARALAPTDDPEAGDRLAAVVDNAGALRVAGFGVRYLDEVDAAGSTGAAGWTAAVQVTYRYRGFAGTDTTVETPVDFVRDGDRVAISGLGGGAPAPETGLPGVAEAPRDDVRTPVWLTGPVDVRRSERTLVVVAPAVAGATGRERGPDEYAALAEAAVDPVAVEVASWDRRLVVEVPSDAAALARALGAPESAVAGAAAITARADGGDDRTGALGVYVNPDVFDTIGRRGAQLVMTHEAVHVATRAPGSPAPTWLVEGLADVVAVRDSGVPEAVAAAQVAEQVSRDGVPDALPGPDDFDTGTGRAGPVYESAWLACEEIVAAADDAALLRVYRRTDAGEDLEAVLREEAGLDVAELTRRWQDRLRALGRA